MKPAVSAALALAALAALALPAAADATMGGTTAYKHETRDAYLIVVDWWYISNPEGIDDISIALGDMEAGISIGEVASAVEVVGDIFRYVFTVEGCTVTVDMASATPKVTTGPGRACDPFRGLDGSYAETWAPPA